MLYQLRRLADWELTLNKGLSLFSNIGRPALLLSGYCYAHKKQRLRVASLRSRCLDLPSFTIVLASTCR